MEHCETLRDMSRPMEDAELCPQHIVDFLEYKLSKLASRPVSDARRESAILGFQQAKSAQQCVLIVTLSKDFFKAESGELLSESCEDDRDGSCCCSTCWKCSLDRGGYKLVVRLWKGTSRWWTLNSNAGDTVTSRTKELEQVARSEVTGYRIARLALYSTTPCKDEGAKGMMSKAMVRIPKVLFTSFCPSRSDGSMINDALDSPWAVFEYVGEESTLFSNRNFRYDDAWTTGMVKIRHEFGYDEPHPRWGRVPVDKCLQYALTVLRQVIIPIHQFCVKAKSTNDSLRDLRHCLTACQTVSLRQEGRPFTYDSMVQRYKDAYQRMNSVCSTEKYCHERLLAAIKVLGHAIDGLTRYYSDGIPHLPPVLCHMDCQPQNILFASDTDRADRGIQGHSFPSFVASVLDWEEAAYADPRFDVLLLCRKVCASREQADIIWDTYAQAMCTVFIESDKGAVIGPLDPWLRLETIHSLTTLLLQSLDLLGGGRKPWEGKSDLWGKIERELGRLGESVPDY